MSKNYADLYNSPNDSIALAQRFYVKLELTAGTLAAPSNTDFFYTLPGGSISYMQPFDSSPHRSGRHHLSIIKKKKELSFSIKQYFNIDTAQGSASLTEIDAAVRVLFKSLFGKEDVTGGSPVYSSLTAPSITFSLYEVGDRWARQARGCFVQDGTLDFPGDGEATIDWSGAGKDALFAGIAKCTSTVAAGNIFHGLSGDGDQFRVGAIVMIVKADGVTRSADTTYAVVGGNVSGYRTITAISGDDITLSGTALTSDSDGSAPSPSYLVYFEPPAPTAINTPVTGLVGSAHFVGLSNSQAIRKTTLKITNNHELVNYVYGSDSLATPFFVPGNRMTCEASIEMNLNRSVLAFFNQVQSFQAKNLTFILGDSASRYFQATLPNINFPVPAFTMPDTGSVPVTFTGNAYETVLDAADEITASFL